MQLLANSNFYPRSPCGERPPTTGQRLAIFQFLSTLSLRRATTASRAAHSRQPPFLSTLSLRRATTVNQFCAKTKDISIHALLAESDYHGRYSLRRSTSFLSTLSLRRATSYTTAMVGPLIFLSTLSLRRATNINSSVNTADQFLSTLSLRRATPPSVLLFNGKAYFYPRSPCGERRYRPCVPLVGRDFYPRSPCGERLSSMLYDTTSLIFLSTLSLRRATLRVLDGSKSSIISIHALLAESDRGIRRYLATWQ